MSVAEKTTTGILWNFAEQLGRRGMQVATTVFLAYYLVPDDFGLLAMMAVFIAIASSLMDSGFGQALIRLPDPSQTDFDTAFFANIALGVLAYLLLFGAAPYIAVFYDESRLVTLVRVTGLVVMINSLHVVQTAIFSRKLDFKSQLKATVPAAAISSVAAIGLAVVGHGVWALVGQMMISALFVVVFLWRMSHWRPAWSFSFRSLKAMYNFGYKLFLSGLLDTVFKNLYIVVIAKIFTATTAGLYFFAEKIQDMVLGQLVGAIQKVTYPALSQLQFDDARLKAGYRKVIIVTTFLLFPAMALLAALAEPLFAFLLPERWAPAVHYLQLLCIAALLYPLHAINLNILKVKGRSDLFLYLEVFKKIMIAAILVISYRYGVIGILVGQIVFSVLAYLPNAYFSGRLIGYSVMEQVRDFLPGLLLSLVVAGAVFAAVEFSSFPAVLDLLIFGMIAGGSYLFGSHILGLRGYVLARELVEKRLFLKKRGIC